jgi:hypothetical protein
VIGYEWVQRFGETFFGEIVPISATHGLPVRDAAGVESVVDRLKHAFQLYVSIHLVFHLLRRIPDFNLVGSTAEIIFDKA